MPANPTTTISTSFVKYYEAEVNEAYQRQGSKLRNTVRFKNNIRGVSAIFPKIGKGSADTKTRNGDVPVMRLAHDVVEIPLTDYYCGEWIDALDELKTNIDERMVAAQNGAYALGRKTDELIIGALDGMTNTASVISGSGDLADTVGLTKAKILAAFQLLGRNEVPDDGERYCVIGWKQWSDLMAVPEFANAQYVAPDQLPWQNSQAKHWLGTLFIPHSGLNIVNGARQCYWYHRRSLGVAAGQDIKTDISWHGDKAAWFVSNMISIGAGLLDTAGLVRMRCADTN
ncbi:MAG: phage capsid protein [Alphaproteobacteria bacterium]|nr:phage capsid protein [Alphaproteobacteria bacterium]